MTATVVPSSPPVTEAAPVIIAALTPVMDALRAAGIRVYDDVQDANPPCVLMEPPVLTFRFKMGSYSAGQTAMLLSSNTVRRAQWVELSDLLEQVQQVLGYPVGEAVPVTSVHFPDGSGVTAAYQISWTDRLTRP
jgi:hypothetical protein